MWRLTKGSSLCWKHHCATVIQCRLRAGFRGLRLKTVNGTGEKQMNAPRESALPKRVFVSLRSNVELRQSYSGRRESSNKKPPCAQKPKAGGRRARSRGRAYTISHAQLADAVARANWRGGRIALQASNSLRQLSEPIAA